MGCLAQVLTIEYFTWSFSLVYNLLQIYIKIICKYYQKRGWSILTCIGLYYICAANIPDLSCPLCYFPILKCGFVGFYDFCWTPIDDVVSYVWFNCQRFWWVGSRGPFGTDQFGLFVLLLVFALFYGW